MGAKIRFISDLHFNHENMAQRRGFKNAEEQDKHIIKKWNSIVSKHDTTYVLGDITMEKKKGYELLDELNGIINVVLGNHDRRQDVRELLNHVNSVAGMINYKNCILTHCPVHSKELDYRFTHNIHGHVHENSIRTYYWDYLLKDDRPEFDKRYINVCVENINYEPKTLEELIGNGEI